MLHGDELQADHWKIYPCAHWQRVGGVAPCAPFTAVLTKEVTPFTRIEHLGLYELEACLEDLVQGGELHPLYREGPEAPNRAPGPREGTSFLSSPVYIAEQAQVHPWIRLNRSLSCK